MKKLIDLIQFGNYNEIVIYILSVKEVKNTQMTLRLRELRESRGITQTYMAKQLGFTTVSAYNLIESEQRGLQVDKAKMIAEIFHVSIEDLFSKDELDTKAN